MKDNIEQILIKVDEGTMPVQQALNEILNLVNWFPKIPDSKPRGGVIRIEARNLVALKSNLTQQMKITKPSIGN